jgi:hypoxanthine phosphoribosyltransferase
MRLGWDDITATADRIAGEVRADEVPDVLVGVLRGGLIPAVLLAHALGVRTVRAVEVLHTSADVCRAAGRQCGQPRRPDRRERAARRRRRRQR